MTGIEGGAADRARRPLLDDAIVEDILADGGAEAGLIDLFLMRSRERVHDLAAAVRDGDAAAVARLAHSLKGSCATYGALRMASVAERLADADGHAVMAGAEKVGAELADVLALTEGALRPLGSPPHT